MTPRRAWFGLLLLLLAAGCNPPTALPTTTVRLGDRDFILEIADGEHERKQGLMQRRSLAGNRGMLFVFPDEQLREFWMKDVPFPLDILFLNAEGRIVSIQTMRPFDLQTTSSLLPARYAIEINAGQARAAGVRVGQVVKEITQKAE